MSLFQSQEYAVQIDVPVTPAIVTYTTGQIIALPFSVANWAKGAKVAAALVRVRLIDPQALNPAVTLYVFNTPTTSAFTVSGAFASQVSAADLLKLVDVIKIPAGSGVDTGVALTNGSYQLATQNPVKVFPALNATIAPSMYILPVAAASIVSPAATPFRLIFDLIRS